MFSSKRFFLSPESLVFKEILMVLCWWEKFWTKSRWCHIEIGDKKMPWKYFIDFDVWTWGHLKHPCSWPMYIVSIQTLWYDLLPHLGSTSNFNMDWFFFVFSFQVGPQSDLMIVVFMLLKFHLMSPNSLWEGCPGLGKTTLSLSKDVTTRLGRAGGLRQE